MLIRSDRERLESPIHTFEGVHQSGVNSLSISKSPHSPNRYCLLSCGDDASLATALLSIDTEGDDVHIKEVVGMHTIATHHCSTIKSCWTDGRVALATGPDQLLSIFKWYLSLLSLPIPSSVKHNLCLANV